MSRPEKAQTCCGRPACRQLRLQEITLVQSVLSERQVRYSEADEDRRGSHAQASTSQPISNGKPHSSSDRDTGPSRGSSRDSNGSVSGSGTAGRRDMEQAGPKLMEQLETGDPGAATQLGSMAQTGALPATSAG